MNRFDFIKEQLKDQYLLDNREWIIGFSGGKDSTMLLQMTWEAVREIPEEYRKKQIHVVANDTLVENPIIIDFLDETLVKIQEQAQKEKMPIVVRKTKPAIEDSFWVNMIGKGYPAPINNFRWCTDRLKIHPTAKYVEQEIDIHGEVIILLGTREDESPQRKKSIQKHEFKNSRLFRHPELSLAYVYAPLKGVTTDEVWVYLMTNKPPWDRSNKKIHSIYSSASSDEYECPTVVTNQEKPSCGTSRFGCWTCTVVKKDKSLKAQIDNGQLWLKPLLDLRNWLVDNRDNDSYRMHIRRNGQAGKGPYTIEKRKIILKKLLVAQKVTKRQLITTQEIKSIQILWNMDGFNDDPFILYKDVYNPNTFNEMKTSEKIKQEQSSKLKKMCDDNGIDYSKLGRLIIEEKNKNLLRKRNNLMQTIEKEFEINN